MQQSEVELMLLAKWLTEVASYAATQLTSKESAWVSGIELGVLVAMQDTEKAKKLIRMIEVAWAQASDMPAEMYERTLLQIRDGLIEQMDEVQKIASDVEKQIQLLE